MSGRTVILAAVGAGCIAAAGVGGFVATRMTAPAQGAAATPVTSSAGPVASEAPALQAPPAPEPPTSAPAEVTRPVPTVGDAPAAKRREEAPKPQPATRPSPATVELPVAAATPTPDPPQPPAQTPIVTPAVVTAPPPPPDSVPPPVVEAPKPRFEELTVTENSVIGIHLDTELSSDTARVEDKVTARVSRDLVVGGHTAIPAGAKLEGNVTLVERGGKFKDRARLGIRFTTLVLADNTRQAIQTDTIYRDGDSPTGEATSKVGASAAIGAILGAVIGGKKGAIIGSTAGAAGGTAAVAAGGRNDATFAAGTPLTVRLTAPLTILIERDFDR